MGLEERFAVWLRLGMCPGTVSVWGGVSGERKVWRVVRILVLAWAECKGGSCPPKQLPTAVFVPHTLL